MNSEIKQQIKKLKQQEKETKKEKKVKKGPPKEPAPIKTILDVFPIRDYNNYYSTNEGKIMDVFQIKGESYYTATEEEVASMVAQSTYFYRRYSQDLKFISLNYPANTKSQQSFLRTKLNNKNLSVHYDMLTEKLAVLEYLENHTTNREYFVMLFADNQNEYETLRSSLFNNSGFKVDSLDDSKKHNIIYKLNNMSKTIKV